MDIQKLIDERFNLIENKLRNSFSAIKANDEDVRKKLSEISAKLEASCSGLLNLEKKVSSNEEAFKKFKKEISRDGLKREIVKEIVPIFNEKIDLRLKSIQLENKELVKGLEDFKKKWSEASTEKLNAGLEEMRANFAKLDKKVVSDVKAFKSSTKKSISDQSKLIDQYSAKIEDYSAELEAGYAKSKKEIVSSAERKINEYKAECDSEINRLRGQIAYLKGKVSNEAGVENKEEKKVVKKNKTLFKNLVSLLADESPEVKVEPKKKEKPKVKPASPVSQKKLENKG